MNLEVDSLDLPRLKDAEKVPEQRPADPAPAMARMNDEILHKAGDPALRETSEVPVPVTHGKTELGVIRVIA